MKFVLHLAITSAISATLPGCGGSPGVDDVPSVTEKMVEIMKTIKDADSAKMAAPKLEALADKIHAYQEQVKSGKNTAPADPGKFADRQMAALTAYGDEMQRISSIPDAAVHLQSMIKKMTPDQELAAAIGKQLDSAVRDLPANMNPTPVDGGAAATNVGGSAATNGASAATAPASNTASVAAAPESSKMPDLRPDANYKGVVADVLVNDHWREWFPSAKRGDFVLVDTGVTGANRHEVLEVVGDTVVIASIHQAGSGKVESRVRMKPGPEAVKPPGASAPLPVESSSNETIVVDGRSLNCEIRKKGKFTIWYCSEVPFDGIVKRESSQSRETLIAFGRGTGNSPDMSAASPVSAAASSAAPTTPFGQSPPQTTQASGAKPVATPSAGGAANPQDIDQKIADLQNAMDKCQEQIERLNDELKEQQKSADELDKKLKRLAMSSSKSKRTKDTRSEFQRDLSKSRSEISRIEREIKKNEDQLDRSEKQMKTLQAQSTARP